MRKVVRHFDENSANLLVEGSAFVTGLSTYTCGCDRIRLFDAAAARLHVTPSAIRQRIKALEQRVGQVLVVREKPCSPTAAGIPLLRLAAQTALLEAGARAEMGGGDSASSRITLAVNADSIATWFTGVFTALDDVLFDIRIEDQDHFSASRWEGRRGQSENLFEQVLEFLLLCLGEAFQALAERIR